MAEDDERRLAAVEFVQMFGDRSHWNEPCIMDAANLMFSGFTDIYQAKGQAAIQ